MHILIKVATTIIMARTSTFLILVKWLFLGWLVLYIWRALKLGNVENFSALDIPINQPIESTVETVETSDCQQCTTSVTGGKLLPVMDPCFNMREVCKQCILLEDHLNTKGKDCRDCIKKHTLAIEALCEEAVGLDKDQKYPDIQSLPNKCRELSRKFINGTDLHKLAQEYRVIRKDLMKKYYDAF